MAKRVIPFIWKNNLFNSFFCPFLGIIEKKPCVLESHTYREILKKYVNLTHIYLFLKITVV